MCNLLIQSGGSILAQNQVDGGTGGAVVFVRVGRHRRPVRQREERPGRTEGQRLESVAQVRVARVGVAGDQRVEQIEAAVKPVRNSSYSERDIS